jgi:exopolysaccharide biosynthesis predicted pyruvyltransferase EpsI
MPSDIILHQILDELIQTNKLLQESNSANNINQWVDTYDLANKLHMSKQTIYRLRKNGVLKSSKIKGKIFFNLMEVEKTLAELQSK